MSGEHSAMIDAPDAWSLKSSGEAWRAAATYPTPSAIKMELDGFPPPT
ncbi:hypothetical protein [Caulobacter sp. S45]|nr:hypothetical protein [Caulobacter sp. S45]